MIDVTINGHPVKIIFISVPKSQDCPFKEYFLGGGIKFTAEFDCDNLPQETIDVLRAMEIQDAKRT